MKRPTLVSSLYVGICILVNVLGMVADNYQSTADCYFETFLTAVKMHSRKSFVKSCRDLFFLCNVEMPKRLSFHVKRFPLFFPKFVRRIRINPFSLFLNPLFLFKYQRHSLTEA